MRHYFDADSILLFYWVYYKTRNTGTRNNGTRNTSGTAEHPGIVAEQLNITWNTSETPQNINGIQM